MRVEIRSSNPPAFQDASQRLEIVLTQPGYRIGLTKRGVMLGTLGLFRIFGHGACEGAWMWSRKRGQSRDPVRVASCYHPGELSAPIVADKMEPARLAKVHQGQSVSRE
jgi:hypothetical protein